MFLALAALAPAALALTTDLAVACAGMKGLFYRPGPVGFVLRRAHRSVDSVLPLLTSVAGAAALVLSLSAGVTTRGGCLGLAAVLALAAHGFVYARVARTFRQEASCLDVARVNPEKVELLRARWEMAMTTRSSLLTAALVCIVAVALMR